MRKGKRERERERERRGRGRQAGQEKKVVEGRREGERARERQRFDGSSCRLVSRFGAY